MNKHPNDFTRRQILRYFQKHHLNVDVKCVDGGYVIFWNRFSPFEGRQVEDPAGRLIYQKERDLWRLYWMSGKNRWHIYDRFPRLHEDLDEMCSDGAAHLFAKVL